MHGHCCLCVFYFHIIILNFCFKINIRSYVPQPVPPPYRNVNFVIYICIGADQYLFQHPEFCRYQNSTGSPAANGMSFTPNIRCPSLFLFPFPNRPFPFQSPLFFFPFPLIFLILPNAVRSR